MATAGDAVRIVGLREFQSALKAMDGESQKQIRVTLNEAAAVVASNAQGRTPVRSGRARASVRVSSTQRTASVSGGSAKVPYFGFLDYGGAVGIRRSVKRPFVKTGRILYPAFEAEREPVTRLMEDGLSALIARNGLGGTGGE